MLKKVDWFLQLRFFLFHNEKNIKCFLKEQIIKDDLHDILNVFKMSFSSSNDLVFEKKKYISSSKINVNLVKTKGQVFTPQKIVDLILLKIGYFGSKILNKKIVDNSCGNGNFLVTIVNIYCNEFLKNSVDKIRLRKELENCIYGVEIDKKLLDVCRVRLNKLVAKYGINEVKWQLFLCDATNFTKLNYKMDFVVGNPPYVRIRNVKKTNINLKNFTFCQVGNTDLYLAFFNIGIKMLKKDGVLGYITPNSFLNSKSGKFFRKFIISQKKISYLKNFGHKQIFDKITTYSAITVLKMDNKKEFFEFENENNDVQKLNFKDLEKANNFIFKNEISEILFSNQQHTNRVLVKNGFATLNDNFFIKKNKLKYFHNFQIKTLKASTGEWRWCIFPYCADGNPLSKNKIMSNQHLFQYFQNNKNSLDKNSKDTAWYLFGRNQGTKDVNKTRFAINNIIKTKDDIKLKKISTNQGIYSGYYILSKLSFQKIKKIIINDHFVNFVKGLGFFKRGGYYFFRSKDLEKFINYKLQ